LRGSRHALLFNHGPAGKPARTPLNRFAMKFFACLLTAASLTWSLGAHAQDANLRKTLSERIPQLEKIDEVRPTPMPGLFEVRIGTDLFYTDAKGNYLIQGELIDTKARRNLTEDRMNQLTAVDFKQLPLKDAITIVHGKGERKMAVFEDPNCGYCKRFERDLQNVDNVTVYLFLYPILSPDSAEKSRNIWCAKDQAGAWADHMQRDKAPAAAQCDTSALQRNLAFGRKYKITGTPTIIFSNNTRVPGAISAQEVEKNLAAAAR
jgi:thiol:disulfide interchange protein DsbC